MTVVHVVQCIISLLSSSAGRVRGAAPRDRGVVDSVQAASRGDAGQHPVDGGKPTQDPRVAREVDTLGQRLSMSRDTRLDCY